ncbi:hypothetical protein L5515_017487 [Caenorhabditis briggsae]|uniref:Uncharacterized protein n=1 Tax=Caenorhabditis briggsae TaxID=6238 RepID=A0AAE9FDA7_CAEBR|nr:hypothetical protein L5515_017487 [Caenorhabditis briggsae]
MMNKEHSEHHNDEMIHCAQFKFPPPTVQHHTQENQEHVNAFYDYNSEENYGRPVNVSMYQPTSCGEIEQEKVKECAEPLYKMGAISENSHYLGWEGFIFRTKSYFSEVCDNFFLFDVCIEPYKDVCFAADKARFNYDAAIKILDFLCRDGYGEMLRNFECFTRTLTRSEMMQCQAELVSDTRKISESHSEVSGANDAAVCGAMRNYIDCVKYPIRYECGYRAWQLVREMIVRPTKAMLPQCKLNTAEKSSSVLTILVVFLVAVLF